METTDFVECRRYPANMRTVRKPRPMTAPSSSEEATIERMSRIARPLFDLREVSREDQAVRDAQTGLASLKARRSQRLPPTSAPGAGPVGWSKSLARARMGQSRSSMSRAALVEELERVSARNANMSRAIKGAGAQREELAILRDDNAKLQAMVVRMRSLVQRSLTRAKAADAELEATDAKQLGLLLGAAETQRDQAVAEALAARREQGRLRKRNNVLMAAVAKAEGAEARAKMELDEAHATVRLLRQDARMLAQRGGGFAAAATAPESGGMGVEEEQYPAAVAPASAAGATFNFPEAEPSLVEETAGAAPAPDASAEVAQETAAEALLAAKEESKVADDLNATADTNYDGEFDDEFEDEDEKVEE